MIHEISPHRFNNQYIARQKLEENCFVLCYRGNSVLLKPDGDDFRLPRKSDFTGIPDQIKSTFLFTLDEIPCFLVEDQTGDENPGLVFQDIGFFRTARQQEVAWIALAGFHLRNWYAQNRFCGKCGTKTKHKSEERALVCPDCMNTVYPKISPAIIVAVTCRDKILLVRGLNFPGSWYSLVAGYADVGESLEETLKREVKEEVGLDVFNIRYYKSQPWPLSGSLMIGFVAEADESQLLAVDTGEIAEAAWFTRGNLPAHAMKLSIAGEMIEKFEKGEL